MELLISLGRVFPTINNRHQLQVLSLLLFTFAELLLSPVGLSVSTKLAPERFRTQMVALFFLSVALGSSMAGVLAGYYDPTNEASYVAIVGGVCVVAGVLLGLAVKPIRKLMSGVH